MTPQEKSEVLRRLVEGESVSVLTRDGAERSVEALEFEGSEFVGWRSKFTKEIIPAEEVEAVVL